MCGDGFEDDKLVRYHFGDLDAAETAEVEQRLARDPDYAARLESLRECLAAEAAETAGSNDGPAPTDLAQRTAEAILAPRAAASCVGRKRIGLLDLTALSIAAAAIAAMIFPALLSARDASRQVACADQMRELSQGLRLYLVNHGSRYPEIGPLDNAGMFSVALADADIMSRDRLQQLLVCPSSELAAQVAAQRASVVVPTRAQIQTTWPIVLERMRRFMGGSYAYRLGYLDPVTGEYVWPESRFNCRMPVLADAPTRGRGGAGVSSNHGACGQNVLFEDGHVEFLSECWAPGLENHFFLNDDGQIAAGRHAADIVLAPSEATPAVPRVVRVRYR